MIIVDILFIFFGKNIYEYYFILGFVNLERNIGKLFLLYKYYMKLVDVFYSLVLFIIDLN